MHCLNYNELKKGGWTKFWSFRFSLLSASILANYYLTKMKDQMGVGFENVIIVSKAGNSTCFLKQDERKAFAQYQIKKYVKEDNISEFCCFFDDKTNNILYLLKSLLTKDKIDDDEIKGFIKVVHEYTGYYTVPRNVIDFINPAKIKKIFDDLKNSRILAEPVYRMIENVILKFLEQISNATGYDIDLLSNITLHELKTYLISGRIPKKKLLSERQKGCALIFNKNNYNCITDEYKFKTLENIKIKIKNEYMVYGDIAFKGIAKGIARIVFNPLNTNDFNEGDILITGMTRPEFLPLMRKAAAIVTDCGGLLCHAAIVARELKKPTLIGTKDATEIFKDGDIVKVDANKGIVWKIS